MNNWEKEKVLWHNFRIVRSRVAGMNKAQRLDYYRSVRGGFLGAVITAAISAGQSSDGLNPAR